MLRHTGNTKPEYIQSFLKGLAPFLSVMVQSRMVEMPLNFVKELRQGELECSV